MDALYGDLENYNEVYIVEELRNENRDLKLKLEEYETAIGKLQKSLLQDYDKLVLEFNNLQTNYSSLLKTARAEVERKAHMITQLNIEKDMMVLKTLQNANSRKFQNKFQNNTQNQKKTTSSETEKVNVDKKTKHEHSLNNESVNKAELKENVAVKNPKTQANSIKDRRKSIPASSILHLTNEDQESDETRNQKLKESLPKEISKTTHIKERFKKISNEAFVTRTSDTTSLSGRSSNSQETSRDASRRAKNNRVDCEQFKTDTIRESVKFTEKIDKHRKGDKIKEDYNSRKEDKVLDIRQTKEGDKHTDGSKFQEGDKYKEENKLRDKYKDGDKFREGEKFKEIEPLREDEKLNEHEKFENETIKRNSNKYRVGDKCRESDRYRESNKYREGDRYWEGDRYKESDRYRDKNRSRENDRYNEANRSRENDKFREIDRSRESDRCREADRARESDRYRMIDNDKFKEDDKYLHTSKFRNREKFDPSHRYKRHYSPNRPYKRDYKEGQDGSKQEYGHRVLRSSTPESHSLSRSRSQEKQLFSEGQKHKSDTHKHLHESTHAERLSFYDNQDEPIKKRQKFEYEIHVDEHRQHHDREPLIKPPYSINFDTQTTSCQSPDAVFSPDSYTDIQTAHTVKEIRNTATTHLEDPRLISKRYVLKTKNGTTTLSSAASQCITIKPVDKSLWDVETVVMPEALIKEPQSHIAEECIKEIYMDIDNPESNASIETGEIVDDTISSSSNQDKDSKDKEKRIDVNDTKKIATKFDVVSSLKTKPENIEKNTIPYEIPVEIPDEIPIKQQLDVPKDLPKIICDDNLTTMIIKDNQHPSTSQSSLPQFDKFETSLPHKNMSKNGRDLHNQISLSEIAMVRDDLELSDETSDNLDYHKHALTDKEKFSPELSTLESKKDDTLNNKQSDNFKITTEANNHLTLEVVVNNTPNESLKECDGHKKQRSKKRKTRDKELDEKNIHVTERKIKSKKDKEIKPNEIKNKFSDLFGDSSSLITPSDLGIPSDYVPLCEDAQDAVDINIKEVVAKQSCANDLIPNETIPKTHRDGDIDINNKEIAASIEDHDGTSDVDAKIIYQNLDAEVDLNKPDIVKTVIISSGVQPQLISENEAPPNNGENLVLNKQNNINFHQVAVDTELKKQTALKALATSTPHKELPFNNAMEPECINIPSDSTSGSIDTNKPAVSQSNTNTEEPLGTPDVRIFVRRRKKGVKKP